MSSGNMNLQKLDQLVKSLNEIYGTDVKIQVAIQARDATWPEALVIGIVKNVLDWGELSYQLVLENDLDQPVQKVAGGEWAPAEDVSITRAEPVMPEMGATDIRICEKCHQAFRPKRKDQRNCSNCAKKKSQKTNEPESEPAEKGEPDDPG